MASKARRERATLGPRLGHRVGVHALQPVGHRYPGQRPGGHLRRPRSRCGRLLRMGKQVQDRLADPRLRLALDFDTHGALACGVFQPRIIAAGATTMVTKRAVNLQVGTQHYEGLLERSPLPQWPHSRDNDQRGLL